MDWDNQENQFAVEVEAGKAISVKLMGKLTALAVDLLGEDCVFTAQIGQYRDNKIVFERKGWKEEKERREEERRMDRKRGQNQVQLPAKKDEGPF